MKQATWRLGLYSKVVLTVIAVSLVGLLVRQLPGKVEAKPEYRKPRVEVVALNVPDLRGNLDTHLKYEAILEKEGKPPLIDPERTALAQRISEETRSGPESLLHHVLTYKYAMGYRVKFMTDDFIILESE